MNEEREDNLGLGATSDSNVDLQNAATATRPGPPPPKPATPFPAAAAPQATLKEKSAANIEAATALFSNARKARAEVNDDAERWLVRINGIDYGPFNGPEVRRRLEADEIDENSLVTDSVTGSQAELCDVPHFSDFVFEYVPKREQRRLAAEERKAELVTEVKKRSVRATFSVALGSLVLAFVGLLGLHVTNVLPFEDVMETVRPTPVEFPFQQVVRNYRFRFEVPEPEYQSMAADQGLVAALFAAPSAGSGRRSSGGSASDAMPVGDGAEEYVLDFDSTKPASKLSQDQVNETLNANVGRISACFQAELRDNPNFRGATLRFSINPSGSTFSVRASTDGGRMSGTAENCLVRAVRSIRFPQFNDVPMSVSYPFYVR